MAEAQEGKDYRIFISRKSTTDSLILMFQYEELGRLDFYQNDRLLQSMSFAGKKKFSFERIEGLEVKFCEDETGMTVIFYDPKNGASPCEDMKIIPTT